MSRTINSHRAGRKRRVRVIIAAVVAVAAVGVAAVPVLRSTGAGQAEAATTEVKAAAPGGVTVKDGYITLNTPVKPIPAPAAKLPFAQYREMHANCKVVRQAPDDPLVFPGLSNSTHGHTFVGNDGVNASSTPESLTRTGKSSCEDKKDTASYWFPTLMQNGKPVPNTTVTFYYKSGVKDYRTVRAFEPGFRMLVGDMKTPNAASFGGEWDCGNPGGTTKEIPSSCRPGNVLILRYMSPSCWDGVHLDTPNHKSHLAYPVGGKCTATHPVAVPMLQSKIAYKLTGGNTKGLTYTSGPSFTYHHDFMNGWDQKRLEELVKHCINGGRQCNGFGIDRHKP